MSKIQSIRGMNDILPGESPLWRHVEDCAETILDAYGYDQIRLPVLEQTALFRRSIGEVTDIVEKEMYTFEDRNGDSLSLRPEGTAGCVRACEQHGLLFNQTRRLWYAGPMFRHERPQKGRLRQFHQIGVEAFGMLGPDIDAELILLSARLWRALGIADAVTLELNNIGAPEARQRYRAALQSFLQPRVEQLDADSRRRLDSNPLRILDSKDADTLALLADAPRLPDFLDAASRAHFERLQELLDGAGLKFRLNERLVRGLDYYGGTVFEWTTRELGAQGTVCAGGRYDALVEQLGGRPTPAVGFALGIERLVLLLEALECGPSAAASAPHAYLLLAGDAAVREGLALAESLRDALPELRLLSHCGGGSVKSQFKRADRSGAQLALVFGEDERTRGEIALKWLRDPGRQQQNIPLTQLVGHLREMLDTNNDRATEDTV